MKCIFLIFLFLSQVAVANVGKVPLDWITPNSQHQKSFISLDQLDSAYKNILDANMSLFKNMPEDSHKRWSLQIIKTEIAIDAGGTIGVMGVGGEAAL